MTTQRLAAERVRALIRTARALGFSYADIARKGNVGSRSTVVKAHSAQKRVPEMDTLEGIAHGCAELLGLRVSFREDILDDENWQRLQAMLQRMVFGEEAATGFEVAMIGGRQLAGMPA